MTFSAIVRRLQDALAAPLPGASAHERMSPQPRRPWPTGFDSARLRHAAGLVLIFRHDDRAHLILTVRTDRLGRHGGQVSLPGGVVDPGETIEQAALREAQEEIGLGETGVRALGTLTPVDIPVSGFRLHPVVAAATGRPALRPSDVEVARILEVPVERLMAPGTVRRKALLREGRTIAVPSFVVDDLDVWGATAMILAEFLTLLGWNGPEQEGVEPDDAGS